MMDIETVKELIYNKAVEEIVGELRVDVCTYKGSYYSLPEYVVDTITLEGYQWEYYIGDYVNDWIYYQVEELDGEDEKYIVDFIMSMLKDKIDEYLEEHKETILERMSA